MLRVVALLFLASLISAFSQEALLSMSPTGKADGKQFNFTVRQEEVSKTPVWSPETLNPPLDPRRAADIARKQLAGLVADITKWQLREISLADFGEHHWIYVVRFDYRYPPNVAVTMGDFFQIPVLM